jgi:pyruvate formate lyase activating enzyme
MDAANVDLKAFTEDFYHRICAAHLEPVKETLKYLVHHTKVWTEITTLLIPGHNDSDEEVGALSEWVLHELGTGVPLHFTAFHPDWRMLDVPPTPPATLTRARKIALDAGLRHVYTGNVHDSEGGTTRCEGCGAPVIVRDWYHLADYQVDDAGRCRKCGARIPGVFDGPAGSFGRRRTRLEITS